MKKTSLFAVSLLSLLVSPYCLAESTNNSVYPDVTLAPQTFIPGDAAINGNEIKVLNTNDEGIAHLYYDNFNIEKAGLKLNNSTANAKLIVNEVVSNQKSRLNGRLSVIGEKAAIVIANPNGIDCNNCSFAGTDNVKLITGKSIMQYSDAYRVTDGAITFAFNNNSILESNPIIVVDQKDKDMSSINIISNKIQLEKGYFRVPNIQFNTDSSQVFLNSINMQNRDELKKDIKNRGVFNSNQNAGFMTRKAVMIVNKGVINSQGIINGYELELQINLLRLINEVDQVLANSEMRSQKSTFNDENYAQFGDILKDINYDDDLSSSITLFDPITSFINNPFLGFNKLI